MHWFLRDRRIYIGPVNDTQIDGLRAKELFRASGMACQASRGKIEVYLTLPDDHGTIGAVRRMETFGITK